MAKQPRIPILVYGDSPVVPTGFATVIRNVFKYLAETGRYHIDIFAIGDRGAWKDPKEHPYKIYPAMLPSTIDPYGRYHFIDAIRGGDIDLIPPWDIIFFLNDPFIFEQRIQNFDMGTLQAVKEVQKTTYLKLPPDQWFKTVAYWPIDSPVKGHWVEQAIALPDYSVAYTKYGKNEIEKADQQLDHPTGVKIRVISHGNSPQDFHPLPKAQIKQFRQEFFGGHVREETFLIIAVGRNQTRKDIPRTMKVFKEFQKRRPDSFLYIHAEEQEGLGSLKEMALRFGLVQKEDWNYPDNFTSRKGFPREVLNLIYNTADCQLSTTLGEGWGLPLTEAMAAKTINVAPNITSIPELFNSTNLDSIDNPDQFPSYKLRGIPVKAGSTSSEWTCHGAVDLERIRPLTNVDDAVKKLLWVYDHPQEVKAITNRAYNWVKRLTWERVAQKWDKLFQKIYQELEKERAHPKKTRLKKAPKLL